MKRAIGGQRRAHEALVAENVVYCSGAKQVRKTQMSYPAYYDLSEGYAGEAVATSLAHKYGLVATEPTCINLGWVLSTVKGAGALEASRTYLSRPSS